MYAPEGTILFQDRDIAVTTDYVLICKDTYALREIRAVEMGCEEPPIGILGAAGALLGVAGILLAKGALETILGGGFAIGITWIEIGAGIFGLGVLLLALHSGTSGKTKYSVRVRFAGGETDIYRSVDMERILRIVAAIKDAMSRRA